MNTTKTFALFAGLTLLTTALTASAADKPKPTAPSDDAVKTVRQLNDVFASVAERVGPAVVSIYSDKVIKMRRPNSPFGSPEDLFRFFGIPENGDNNDAPNPRRRPPQQQPRQRDYNYHQPGMGSGIIIDREGHILTNNHVVDNVDEIKVTLADKRSFEATVTGTDPKTDLAVIKIKGKIPADLPVAELGDSDAVRIGEMVLAIGAPFGYPQTVTHGIISAKGRSTFSTDNYEDFIQTDAAINPGNSGGPLVNLDGKIIGINSAIATRIGQFAGVGFAIPSKMAQSIWPTLAKGGKISRGMLGVIIQNIDADLKDQLKLPSTKGAIVSQVNKDSAAEKAGIKVEDVITRYNGKEVEDVRALRNAVAATAPGTKTDVTVLRDGTEKNLTVKLGELKTDDSEEEAQPAEGEASAGALGITVETLTADTAKQFGLDKADKGAVVREIEDGSAAATAGLRVGDLITEVNRQKISTAAELRDALKTAKGKTNILMLVKRDGASRFVIIKPGAPKE
jgi:serine protease Do